MTSIYFLLALLAMGYLLYWTITNDQKAPDRADLGLFAMKQPEQKGGDARPVRPGAAPND